MSRYVPIFISLKRHLHLFEHGSFIFEDSPAELEVDVIPRKIRLYFVLRRIEILLESNDGGDRRDGDDFRMIISGVIDNASYDGENDNAYKIVHLGEVFRSREFKGAGKLHNLTNVDTSILTWNRCILSCQVLS